jgi:hypothetical protein
MIAPEYPLLPQYARVRRVPTVDIAESFRASALWSAVLTLRSMHTPPPHGWRRAGGTVK